MPEIPQNITFDHVLAAAVALLSLWLIWVIYRRIYACFLWAASPNRQFMLVENEVFKKTIKEPTTLKPAWLSGLDLARGARLARRFVIQTSRDGGEELSLMNAQTGALDMTRNTIEMSDISVQTAERHNLVVDVSVTFKLDEGTLGDVLELGELGAELRARTKSIVKSEVLVREDRTVAAENQEIEETVKTRLTSARLGVQVTNVSVQTRDYTTAPGDMMGGGEDPEATALISGGAEALANNVGLTPRQLDKLRDVFLPAYHVNRKSKDQPIGTSKPAQPELSPAERREREMLEREDYARANELTIRFLELWTQRVAAKALGRAKGAVIVVPSDDVGVAGTALYRRIMADLKSQQQADDETS